MWASVSALEALPAPVTVQVTEGGESGRAILQPVSRASMAQVLAHGRYLARDAQPLSLA